MFAKTKWKVSFWYNEYEQKDLPEIEFNTRIPEFLIRMLLKNLKIKNVHSATLITLERDGVIIREIELYRNRMHRE